MPTLPTPEELLYMQEHISDDRRTDVIVANAICFAIAVIAVTLRFTSRRLARVYYGWDDWSVMVALVSCHSVRAGILSNVATAALRSICHMRLHPYATRNGAAHHSSH